MDAEGAAWMLLSCVMVLGASVPYLPQYQEIQRSGNTEGFSTRVCLVLLVANILRVFFWIGKRFELTLLLQSVVMILTMLAMLRLCCAVQNGSRVSSTRQHRLSELDPRYFWKWSAFEDYVLFCLGLTVAVALVTALLLDSSLFVEALGALAVLFEAMLGLPQLLQNLRKRSTRGMSVKMVLLWTLGDVFKTAYFVMNDSPAQFWACGSVQILIDVAILLQVLLCSEDTRVKLG